MLSSRCQHASTSPPEAVAAPDAVPLTLTNYLSELADGTGGELYWAQGLQNPVSLAPYLKDFAVRLENQYLLTVRVTSAKNELEAVRVQSARAGLSLAGASKIEVAAGRSSSEP